MKKKNPIFRGKFEEVGKKNPAYNASQWEPYMTPHITNATKESTVMPSHVILRTSVVAVVIVVVVGVGIVVGAALSYQPFSGYLAPALTKLWHKETKQGKSYLHEQE